MDNGWIKLHRKTLDNVIVNKDNDHLAVWIYLLLNAVHKDTPWDYYGKKIDLKKGQLIIGRKKVAEQLKISESKLQRILKRLENEHQIEQQTNGNKARIITILKWDEYQQSEQQNEHQVNTERTPSEHRANTKQELKELNNNIYIHEGGVHTPLGEAINFFKEKNIVPTTHQLTQKTKEIIRQRNESKNT